MNVTSGYTFSFVFCLQFLLTSFLLISTKYLINLFIYSIFFGELFSADPAFLVWYQPLVIGNKETKKPGKITHSEIRTKCNSMTFKMETYNPSTQKRLTNAESMATYRSAGHTSKVIRSVPSLQAAAQILVACTGSTWNQQPR